MFFPFVFRGLYHVIPLSHLPREQIKENDIENQSNEFKLCGLRLVLVVLMLLPLCMHGYCGVLLKFTAFTAGNEI